LSFLAIFAHFGSVNKEYKDKVKALYLNISNKKNRHLREKLLTFQIDAPTLVTMPKEVRSSRALENIGD